MIELENINVRYRGKNGDVEAVRDVSLKIGRGEIFGIVGTSGAGKSSLVRTINLLERPSGGTVRINSTDVTGFSGSKLRRLRQRIGMIFQQFNLIHTKTVYDNVAFAMKIAGSKAQEIKRRVPELLALVGLEDKADVFPAKLSGGQKQRVGIARALANSPDILLCDEPTSALDLETTASILKLIRDINRELGITVVIITHEMAVIKAVCDRVAVMHAGEVVEQGDVYDVFARPGQEFTRQLLAHTLNLDIPPRLTDEIQGRLLKLSYHSRDAEAPLICETAKIFDVVVNILHGRIEYINGQPLGILVVSLGGAAGQVELAMEFLNRQASQMEVIK